MEILILEWLLRLLEAASLSRHLFRWLNPRIRDRLVYLLMRRLGGGVDYVRVECDESLVRTIVQMEDSFFLEATGMTEEGALGRFHHNHNTFAAIMEVDRKTGHQKIVGYYSILPITKHGVKAILDGHIEAGRHLRDQDISRSFRSPQGIYISAVCGVGNRARVATTNYLTADILNLKDRRAGLKWIFTRPTTPEGRAIFRNLTGRVPAGEARIQEIDFDSDIIRKQYLERGARIKGLGVAASRRNSRKK